MALDAGIPKGVFNVLPGFGHRVGKALALHMDVDVLAFHWVAGGSTASLAAGVWTSDLSKAHTFARGLRAGSVWVNQYDGGDMTAPFGGFKQSGNGRDKSLHAFDKYTELKATWIKL